jgi:hypothetical protein
MKMMPPRAHPRKVADVNRKEKRLGKPGLFFCPIIML